MNTILSQASGENWTAAHGDCVEAIKDIPDASIDFSVYSPPFSNLYIYSDSVRDLGNTNDDAEFFEFYAHLIREKLRVTKTGRLSSIHVKDLVYYSNASDKGDRGLRDFTGECIRAHVAAGWTYHSRVTIWRDPVLEMQKSKPDGLLYKNFRTDACRIRVGNPEYLITFRKWGAGMEDAPAVQHPADLVMEWAGEGERFIKAGRANGYEKGLDIWQNWASPVWMDCRATDVLNAKIARDEDSERHLCPMPLDITERAIRMWSNPGDVVLSPFMGIGSEGYVALKTGRKFIGCELNEGYYRQAVKYLTEAEQKAASGDLLEIMQAAE